MLGLLHIPHVLCKVKLMQRGVSDFIPAALLYSSSQQRPAAVAFFLLLCFLPTFNHFLLHPAFFLLLTSPATSCF